MDFEEIATIDDLEQVSAEVIWQNFERLTGFILEKNDFSISVGIVKTSRKKRRQYDVIAWKNDRTLLVECKKWAGNYYRLSALKKAVGQHKERTGFYESLTGEDAVPVVVTLIEETVMVYDGVPLVPVTRLNAFLNELDRHADGYSFDEYEDLPEDGAGGEEEPGGERYRYP